MPGHVHGKIGKIENQRQHRDKNEPLQKAVFRGLLGKVPDSGNEAEAQRRNQNDKSDEDGKKIKRVAGARVGHSFLVTIVRKGVAIYLVAAGSVRRSGGGGGLLWGGGGGRGGLLRRRRSNSGSFLRQGRMRQGRDENGQKND